MGPAVGFGAFGLTSTSSNYTVDTGGGLIFKIGKSSGNLESAVFNGLECIDKPGGASGINLGMGWIYRYQAVTNGVTNTYANLVRTTATNVGTDFVKITVLCTLTNAVTSETNVLTHYYIARKSFPHVYMATCFNSIPANGGCAFMFRFLRSNLPNGPTPSDLNGVDGTVEDDDVRSFSMTNSNVALRGQTRSKKYSNHRLMDWSTFGVYNNRTAMLAAWVVRCNQEGGSGGPFFRIGLNQGTDTEQQYHETFYYGMGNLDSPRFNVLNGPYTMVFTPGTPPPEKINTSWLTNSGFNLTNFYSDAQRGRVVGAVSGVPTGFQAVVGFSNDQAQYWCIATNGTYQSPLMIPGTYNQVLYKGELEVATNVGVVVRANATTSKNIFSQELKPLWLWRIGEWDGSPVGFKNARKATNGLYPNDLMVNSMHPSDIRMANWSNTACTTNPYVIGRSIPSEFPCYSWISVNTPVIKFVLTPAQIKKRVLRVGITTAFSGARPGVTLNNYNAGYPSPSVQADYRNLTTGIYRGNNTTFTYSLPASAFVVGTNTISLWLVSGSRNTATPNFLNPGVSYDCVELD